MFIARYDDEGRPQPLDCHLKAVAQRTSTVVNPTEYGAISGLLHDVGKYSHAFRQYIERVQLEGDEYEDQELLGRVDHSTAGAQFVMEILRERADRTGDVEIQRLAELIGRIIAHCVAGHHSGLLNGITPHNGSSLERRLRKDVEPYKENMSPEIVTAIGTLADNLLEELRLDHVCKWIDSAGNIGGRDAFSLQFAIRMLFSALVDADRLHSEETGNPAQWADRQVILTEPLPTLKTKLEAHLATLTGVGTVNQIRKQVSEQCRRAVDLEKGIFDLTVPTGGGKTLASLRFGLHHATLHKMERIIYVIPYTSIIDQNAEVFRSVLDSGGKTNNVLEHHSNIEPTQKTIKSELLAANWSAPVVATTSVRFFETLFTNRPSLCRRLHAIQNSVIILDEVQTVPVRYLQAVTWVLEELVRNFGCTIILCTATQPLLDTKRIDGQDAADNHRIGLKDIRHIIEEPAQLYRALKRVEVEWIKSNSPLSMSEVSERIAKYADKGRSVLSIVNTKKIAASLYADLSRNERFAGRLFHLSTAMCPQHRKDVLALIRKLTIYGRKMSAYAPIVSSTQLVEAGVDLDFDVVFRSMAGIDSIAQAAGRCNREGDLSPCLGETIVYEAEEELGSLIDIIEAKRAGMGALSAIESEKSLSAEQKDALGLKAVEEYFERLYWSRRDEMDKEQIVSRLNSCRQVEYAADIPFADIAADFRLIKEDTVSVLVPYGARGKSLVSELKSFKTGCFPSHHMMSELQEYSVQVYRSALPLYQGIIEETSTGWLVVDSTVHYTEIGLNRPENLDVEDLIL
jgi:CRISPR-associated endonuclease/helicase Cas3